MGTHYSFIFRGYMGLLSYVPYVEGLKLLFFMVLGSKGGLYKSPYTS